jgi:virginiamycin B lyase
MRRSRSITAALSVAALTVGASTHAHPGPSITELPTPAANSLPQGVDVGGARVVYAETAAGAIVEVGPDLATRAFPLPGGGAPNVVKVDGESIWFTDGKNAAIGRLDPLSGAVVELPVPSGAAPFFLALGADGSRWFSEPSGVGRLSPEGVVTEWVVTLEHPDDNIEEISLDPHGDLWFAERNFDGAGPAGTNLVRRLDPRTNVVSEYRVPTLGGNPAGVLARPDGKVWVSEYFADRIALLDPAAAPHVDHVLPPDTGLSSARRTFEAIPPRKGSTPATSAVVATTSHVTPIVSPGWIEYPLPMAGANAEDMRVDALGRLVFEEDAGTLGVLDPVALTVTEYPIPTANSGYYTIALAPDGRVWFTEAAIFAPGIPSQIGVLVR